MMGANYRKPNQEIEISMIPKWMNLTMRVCKWFIYLTPFVMTSVMLIAISELTFWYNWLLTSMWILSLSNIVRIVDEK